MDIGAKLKATRMNKGITIAQICEATGLTKGFISNVENNKTSPSIKTLKLIADCLKVPLAYLLLEEHQSMNVVRKNERRLLIAGDDRFRTEYLGSKDGLQLLQTELKPGAVIDHVHAQESVECHLVFQGRILVEQGDESEILEAGDSFCWNAVIPHRVKNIGETPAVVLIAEYSSMKTKAVD